MILRVLQNKLIENQCAQNTFEVTSKVRRSDFIKQSELHANQNIGGTFSYNFVHLCEYLKIHLRI